MTPEQFSQAFGDIAGSNYTVALVVIILGNLALGVINALKDGTFNLADLGNILKKVLPFVLGGYFGLGTAGEAQGGTAGEIMKLMGAILGSAPFVAGTVKEGVTLLVPGGGSLSGKIDALVTAKPAILMPPAQPSLTPDVITAISDLKKAHPDWTSYRIQDELRAKGLTP